VSDGRWVTILAWCLVQSHGVFVKSGGTAVKTRSEQGKRYGWLRPLELMWVARTIQVESESHRGRGLAGQQAVKKWCENDYKSERPFAMTPDQYRRYRQAGMYGGYRVAFRRWPGLTQDGDGWTPGPATNELAKRLDEKLGAGARPKWKVGNGGGGKNFPERVNKEQQDKEHVWWIKHWEKFDKKGPNAEHDTLPRRGDDTKKLPEWNLLKKVAFGDDTKGKIRVEVACAIAEADGADHASICAHLSKQFASDPAIAALSRFSRLADAGINAMNLIKRVLGDKPAVKVSEVANHRDAKVVCRALVAAAQQWDGTKIVGFRHIDAGHQFADCFKALGKDQVDQCLKKLLAHHEEHRGGLCWFVLLRNGEIEPRTLPRTANDGFYRFRLWALCRLATQCGVIKPMPTAFGVEPADDGEDDNG